MVKEIKISHGDAVTKKNMSSAGTRTVNLAFCPDAFGFVRLHLYDLPTVLVCLLVHVMGTW